MNNMYQERIMGNTALKLYDTEMGMYPLERMERWMRGLECLRDAEYIELPYYYILCNAFDNIIKIKKEKGE